MRGREVEAARNGAFAAFLVGTAEVVPILVDAAKKRDHELRNNAPIWLQRLFARDQDYEELSSRARAKWLGAQREIPTGVVFRMGKPRDERELVELLRGDLADDARKELEITLGDFGASRLQSAREQCDLYERARAARRSPGASGLSAPARHRGPDTVDVTRSCQSSPDRSSCPVGLILHVARITFIE